MRIHVLKPVQRKQRGQTLLLVAASLFTLVAMAALAIDLTTLYTARSEMQRAADAAALAGARAFVDSGITTGEGGPEDANLRTLAQNLVTGYVNAVLAQNKVGGVQPTLVGTLTPNYTNPGNPQLSVTLQRTNLPTFFSRIFGRRAATVSATAIAEAYNSSAPPGSGKTGMPPIAPTCVKPWLIPNIDPNHGNATFVSADGSITNPGVWTGTCGAVGSGGALGECIALNPLTAPIVSPLTTAGYLPAALTAPTSGTCPSCAAGDSNFAQSVACCDTANAAQYACASTTPLLSVGTLANLVPDTLAVGKCLLQGVTGSGSALGLDSLQGNFQSSGGQDPIEIRSSPLSPHPNQMVTTSNQIVTLPIISTNLVGLNATVTGYMEGFVQSTSDVSAACPLGGCISLYVLNISGCGTNVNPALPAVSGGGVSAVPVRLIHQ